MVQHGLSGQIPQAVKNSCTRNHTECQCPALGSDTTKQAHSLSKRMHEEVPAWGRESLNALLNCAAHMQNSSCSSQSWDCFAQRHSVSPLFNMLDFSNLVACVCTLSSLAVLVLSSSLCTRLPSGASVVRSLCVEVLSWPLNSRQTSHGCSVCLDLDKAVMETQQPRT